MPVDPSKQSQLREEIELDPRLDFKAVHQTRSRKLALAGLPWVLVVILCFINSYLYWQANIGPGPSNGWETDFGT